MSDPLHVLWTPVVPIRPDPAFTERLAARLDRAITQLEGGDMTDHDPSGPAGAQADWDHNQGDQAEGAPAGPAPVGPRRPAVVPYLAVSGAERALEFYGRAFGARLRGRPVVMPDGRIGHAELDVAGGTVYVSEEHPEIGVVAPAPGHGASVTIHLEVPDVDRALARARAAGALEDRPATDYEHGRNAVLRDPFGHRWMLAGPVRAAGPVPGTAGGLRHGDLGYASLWVPDVAQAAEFFSTVLGWRYGPASGPGGRQVEGLSLHHGLWGGFTRSTLFCCFAVADVEVAAARVRAAGGSAGRPHQEPYGLLADCVDDQGSASPCSSRRPGWAGGRPGRPTGRGPGTWPT